jgi:steroid 5-alpha reductase family enzyme
MAITTTQKTLIAESTRNMFDINTFCYTLVVLFGIAIVLWIASRIKKDVGIVDSFWSLMILAAGICFLLLSDTTITDRHSVVILLLTAWAIRLSFHITWRNWGQEEDSRYQTIRKNNQTNFELKSLYIVFLLQAFLAVIVALPLMSIFSSNSTINILDYLAFALWLTGMLFETVGDLQLTRFKTSKRNQGKVLNSGLWRYSRHPNYFGEFCIWWAFFLFAVASGYWWSIVSPLLMTTLLLKVSGVSLLESTISERRPEYARYCITTNAFLPWFPKKTP